MRLAVCLKQVISREWPLRVADAGTWVRDDQASWELNEPDAYALEEALRLRERTGGEVLAVSAGPARVTQVLRDALARGADRAIHVAGEHMAEADAFTTASVLAEALRAEPLDLVLTGLQSNDQGAGQVGGMLAELLGLPHATLVVAIDPFDQGVRVKQELEGGWCQWVTLPLPALVTIQSGINQLRYATLKGIMAARSKPVRTVEAPAVVPAVTIEALAPPHRRPTTLIEGPPDRAADDLVRRLRDSGAL